MFTLVGVHAPTSTNTHTHSFDTTDINTRLRIDGWTVVGQFLMPKHNVPWYGRNSYIGIELNTTWFDEALSDVRGYGGCV